MGQSFAVAAAIAAGGLDARAQPAPSAQPVTSEQAITEAAPAATPPAPGAPKAAPAATADPSNKAEAPPPLPPASAQPGSFSAWRGAAARAGRIWGPQGAGARRGPWGLDPELAEWDKRNATVGGLQVLSLVSAQLFVWPYLASTIVGGFAGECGESCGDVGRDLQWVGAPVLGPFIAAAVLGDRIDADEKNLLIADGVLQTVGLAGFLGFKLLASHIDNQPWKSERRASFQIAPVVVPGGGGLGITGSF